MKDTTIFFTARRARCIYGVEEKEELRDQDASKCLTALEELVYKSRSWRPPERQHEEASLLQLTALRGYLRVAAALVRSLDSISPVKEQTCWLKSLAEPRNSIRRREDSSGAPNAHTFYIFTGDISSFLPFSLMT